MLNTKLKGKYWKKITITYIPGDGSITYAIENKDENTKPYYKIEDNKFVKQ